MADPADGLMAVEVPILVNNGMQTVRAIPLYVPVADPWFRGQIKPIEQCVALLRSLRCGPSARWSTRHYEQWLIVCPHL